MRLLEFLDRRDERRLERLKLQPHRPFDVRMFVGLGFFVGYYLLVWRLMGRVIPSTNAALVRDAMLVLGPVVGVIAQALFRSDVKDELAAQNTGEAFRASRAQAEATKAAAETTPSTGTTDAARAAGQVADAAVAKASDIRHEVQP